MQQIVFTILDSSGDSQVRFNPEQQLDAAKERYNDLVDKGHLPVRPGPNGTHEALPRVFNPNEKSVMFIHPLKGG